MRRQFLSSATFGGWVAGVSGAAAIVECFDPSSLATFCIALSLSLLGVLFGLLVDAVSGGGPR